MKFLEKSCVGCGSDFLVHELMVNQSLYCTSSCQNNHSIFIAMETEGPNDSIERYAIS